MVVAGNKNIGKRLFGKEGEQIQFIIGQSTERMLIGELPVLSDNDMNHWHESERQHRSVDSPNWHGVSDAVVAATTMVQEISSKEDIRRVFIWDESLAIFEKVVRGWEEGDKVLVSSANAASDSPFVSNHPSRLAIGATRGLLFCSTLFGASQDEIDIHESWDIVQVPLKSGEGRLLATLRMLPLVVGRQDINVTVVIINGGYSKQDSISSIFQEMESLGVKYGTYKSGWAPINMGQFWSIGRAFETYHAELRYAFAKFGHVYGTDEVWLLTHNPIAVVSQSVRSDERRALCWKPKTIVDNVRWIIWGDTYKSEGESYYRRPVTNIQDILKMDTELLPTLRRIPSCKRSMMAFTGDTVNHNDGT